MSYQTSSKMPRPFWLLIGAENFCVFLPSQKATSLWVVSCVLTRNDICSSVARHVSLGRSPRLCSRWKVPILAQNVRNIFRYLRENLTGKDAGPFAGIITVAYLKVCENIHRFTDVFWIQGEGGGGGGARVVRWWEHSPPTILTQVQIPVPTPYAGVEVLVDSLPCSENFFSGYSGQFPSP